MRAELAPGQIPPDKCRIDRPTVVMGLVFAAHVAEAEEGQDVGVTTFPVDGAS